MLTLLRDLRRLRHSLALGAPDRGRSLAIRHVDAGSCNACEHELTLMSSPYYDLQRFGLGIVASPRHADVLLVTGPVTTRMREPLLVAYNAMPEPRRVAALGDCALGCNVLGAAAELVGPRRRGAAGRPPDPGLPADACRDRGGTSRLDRRRTRGPDALSASKLGCGVVALAGPGREDHDDAGAALACDAVPLAGLEREQGRESGLDGVATRLDARRPFDHG